MKAFSLEEYLKNPSKKVVTRDGRKARIVATDIKCKNFPIVAAVTYGDGQEICLSYTSSGKYSSYRTKDYNDIFFAAEKHKGWINVYRDFDGTLYCGSVFATEEDAKCNAKTAIATVKIEWEE